MVKPKMVLFDYGQTLITQEPYNTMKGFEALHKYIVDNPFHITAKDMNELSYKIYKECNKAFGKEAKRDWLIDVRFSDTLSYILEYYHLKMSITLEECDELYWDYACNGTAINNVDKFLKCLVENGIRTGVVSNLSHSSRSLKKRLERLIPNHKFEFVISSSDIIFRKPNPMIFQLAMAKSQLAPEEHWYCGDDSIWDINAAFQLGIQPIWYTGDLDYEQEKPEVPYVEIKDWLETIDLIRK